MSELIHIEATDDQLLAAAIELSEKRAQTYLSEARKEQIGKQMAHIFFEIHCREQEASEMGVKIAS